MSIAFCTDVQNPRSKHETIELTSFKNIPYRSKPRAYSLPSLNQGSKQKPFLVRSSSLNLDPESPVFGRRNSNFPFPYRSCVYLPLSKKENRTNGLDFISSSDPSIVYKIVWISSA